MKQHVILICVTDERFIFNDRCTFVRRRPDERYLPDYVSQRVKHPTQVMIWSIISSKGVRNLYFVDGTMQVLRNELRPQLRFLWPDGIKYNRVWLVLTDQASYMLSALSALKMLYNKLRHVICIVHALHRVCESVRMILYH